MSSPRPRLRWPAEGAGVPHAVAGLAGANVTMWMNDVAAAWLMTSLTDSPVMVALVQAASTLPVFVLACPAARWPTSWTGGATSPSRSCGSPAWRWCCACARSPMCSRAAAARADLRQRHRHGDALAGVRRHRARGGAAARTAAALALNGVAMNMSRVIGPWWRARCWPAPAVPSCSRSTRCVGGGLRADPALESQRKVSALPGERFVGAMRVGLAAR